MKLNNKGFAISSIMYIILVLAIVLITLTLAIFSNRKMIIEKQKEEVLSDIYSELPSSYQKVEYIESTGTQYIDTGVIPNQNTGFDIVFLSKNKINTTEFGSIIGAREGSSVNELQLTTYSLSSSMEGTLRYGTTSNNAGLKVGEKTNITLKNKYYTNNNEVSYTLTQSFQTPVTLTVFALNANGYKLQNGSLQLYSLKLYDGDILVRNFVPCYKKDDGEIGLYDMVENKFYTNLGTGTFIKGVNLN